MQLALLALGQLLRTGSSDLPWSVAQARLAELIGEFGPASRTSPAQSAAYPFTRMRSDGVWQIDADVPMEDIGPLRETSPTGSFFPAVEAELLASPQRALTTARVLVTTRFAESLAADVLTAAGLDPELVLGADGKLVPDGEVRRRSASWRTAVIETWDRQCAFCGYDGQLGGSPVGLDAAHVRWFSFGGPDEADNGPALCSLHHKLFDRGALGLDAELVVLVSGTLTARTDAGKAVYELHGMSLRPRPETARPAAQHVAWHRREVFKGVALAA